MRWLQSLALLSGGAAALTPAQWRSQSIYQVITDRFALANGSTSQPCELGQYCGGTWQGIINKLDYIKGMGFTAVWISPVVKNVEDTIWGKPYHGYWAQDIYSINPAFGTEADLKALSSALHARGMYLMVDVVANHMAFNGDPSQVAYGSLRPFNDQKYYHPYCPIDYGNSSSVQVCWMGDTKVPLPDLKTEDPAVQNAFNQWIAQLVQRYGIDGLRYDSAMQTSQNFWPGFVAASGVYGIGEVLDGNPSTFCPWQNYMPGMLNYVAYFWIKRAFHAPNADMTELANNIQWLRSTCTDVTLLANFIENHDNPRFPTVTTDTGLIKNAIAFTVFNDGIPIIYYGQEQGFSGGEDPLNREALWKSGYSTKSSLYTYISQLNAARKLAIGKDSTYASLKSSVVYSDATTLVTKKGSSNSYLLTLFTNSGATGNGQVTVPAAKTGVTGNTQFTDLLSCNTFTADSSGNLIISISNGQPRSLFPSSSLTGSDVCAYTNNRAVSVSSAAETAPTTTTSSPSQPVPSSNSRTAALTHRRPVTPSCPASNSTSDGHDFPIECGLDGRAGALPSVQVQTMPQCLDACAGTPTCASVALKGGTCAMHSVTPVVYDPTVVGARLISTVDISSPPPPPPSLSRVLSTSSVTSSSSSPSMSSPSSCADGSPVAVSFFHNVTTAWTETIAVVGSIPELGSWDPSRAASLSADAYTTTNPVWNTTVRIGPGVYFEYKFVKDGVTWEADPNRNFTTPKKCGDDDVGVVLRSRWQM